jgi:hypothetical protein
MGIRIKPCTINIFVMLHISLKLGVEDVTNYD